MSDETPGQAIRRLREARPDSPSRETVARAVGVSNGAVSQWEADVIVPRRGNAAKLDDYLEAGGAVLDAFGYVRQPQGRDADYEALRGRVAVLEGHVGLLLEVAGIRVDPGSAPPQAPSADG